MSDNFEPSTNALMKRALAVPRMTLRLFICRWLHPLSWPRTDKDGAYQRCLEDGSRVPYQCEELVPDKQAVIEDLERLK